MWGQFVANHLFGGACLVYKYVVAGRKPSSPAWCLLANKRKKKKKSLKKKLLYSDANVMRPASCDCRPKRYNDGTDMERKKIRIILLDVCREKEKVKEGKQMTWKMPCILCYGRGSPVPF